MIEGKTSKDHFKTKVSLIKYKDRINDLLKILTDFSITYLEGQIYKPVLKLFNCLKVGLVYQTKASMKKQ